MSTDTHNFAHANKAHFDSVAREATEVPGIEDVSKKTAEAILKLHPFDKTKTAVLDFACGAGLISELLYPHASSIVGVDLSQAMVDAYNKRVEGTAMKAVVGDLLRGDKENHLDGRKFDVIVCTLAYHHFPSLEDATRILASYLTNGGSLIVSEFLKFPMDPEKAGHIIPHKKFTEDDFTRIFEGADLTKVAFEILKETLLYENECTVVVCRGVKEQ